MKLPGTKTAIIIASALLMVGCSKSRKYEVHLYKQLEAGGRIATFDSDYPGMAEENCRIFADLHEKAYGIRLTCSQEKY